MEQRHFLVLISIAALLVFAGCLDGLPVDNAEETETDQNQETGTVPPVEVVSPDAVDTVIAAENAAFQRTATVASGDTVRFVNHDSFPHTVTVKAAGIDREVQPGKAITLKFNQAGSYTVVCTIHPGMKTTVTVEDDTTP